MTSRTATSLLAVSVLAAAGLALAARPAPAAHASAHTQAQAAPFAVDAVHSTVIYRVKHLNVSWSYGRFNDISGSFLIDKDAPENTTIDVTVKAASVDSANTKRNEHLSAPDFFSVKEFPTITFKSASAVKTGERTLDVTGDLTFHGTTKRITVPVELVGQGKGMRGGEVSGFESTFTIKRSDYGMGFLPDALGDEVKLIVSLEGARS